MPPRSASPTSSSAPPAPVPEPPQRGVRAGARRLSETPSDRRSLPGFATGRAHEPAASGTERSGGAVASEGTREGPHRGIRGRGAQRQSKGLRSAATRARRPLRPSAATGSGGRRGGVGCADHNSRFQRAKRGRKRRVVPPPLMPFFVLRSIRSFSGGSRLSSAASSGETGVTPLDVTPRFVANHRSGCYIGTGCPWKDGVSL